METEFIQALHEDLRGQDWRWRARCLKEDPEIFHSSNAGVACRARIVCASCPVQMQCHEYAVRTRQRFGVFGGLGARARARGESPELTDVHGTRAALDRHRARNEYPCIECVEWKRVDNRRKRKAS